MEELQDYLDGIATWGAVNGMELNASKCHVLELTRARRPFNRATYTVGGTVLEYSTTELILGVHVSSDLRWKRTPTSRAAKRPKCSRSRRATCTAAPRASSGWPTCPWSSRS
jgi:hypothetical protein